MLIREKNAALELEIEGQLKETEERTREHAIAMADLRLKNKTLKLDISEQASQ